MTDKPDTKKYEFDTNNVRGALIGFLMAALVLGFIAFAVFNMHEEVGQTGLHGVITGKEFTPLKETQITVGAQGVHQREVDGRYVLEVHVDRLDKDYIVDVDKRVYNDHKVGDKYFFVRPPEELRKAIEEPLTSGQTDEAEELTTPDAARVEPVGGKVAEP